MKTVGILFQPKVPRAVDLAAELVHVVERAGARVWASSAWDEARVRDQMDGTDFAVTLGGDGTVLRAARLFAPVEVPLVGVNVGRVGFMTELDPSQAADQIGAFLRDEAWVEERLMLQASLSRAAPSVENSPLSRAADEGVTYHVLNDVVVGRGAVSRMIRVRTSVDGAEMTTYAVDAVIVATPS